jgi:hypothetical protein
MGAQTRRAQRQQQRGCIGAMVGLDQRDRDRGPFQRGRRLALRQARKAGATRGDIPSRGIIEWRTHPA